MDNILIEYEKTILSFNDLSEEFTVNFMLLNDDIVNIDKEDLCKIVSTTNCINLHELLISEDVNEAESIFKRLVEVFEGEKVSIKVKTPFSITDNVNKIIENIRSIDNVKSVSIVEGKELIRGYKKTINKYKNIPQFQANLYRLVKKQVVEYLLMNNKDKLNNLYKGEKNRVSLILKKQLYSILNSIADGNDIYKLDIPVIKENMEIQNIEISITKNELYLIPIIKGISNNNISKEQLYEMREEFKVTFISPFSFGKSTLINALVGEDILKTDLRAETAVITKLINSEDNVIISKWNTGAVEEAVYLNNDDLINKLKGVTSVREDGNSVEEVSITYKNSSLEGITIVDSPGLFSRYDHHNKIAMKALYEADMVIFVVDPCKIGESNFNKIIKENIDELINNNKNFCFVLSKLDMYEEDSEKILKEMNIVLEELKLEHIPVIFTSAYFALKGKLLKENKIAIDELRKDRNIFVIKDDDIISGRLLRENHWKDLIKFSRIDELSTYIKSVKEFYKWQM